MTERNSENKAKKCPKQCDRFKKFLEKIKGAISVSLIVIVVIHVASIVIGVLYLEECPVQRNVPIFLIAIGVIGLFTKILGLARDLLFHYMNVDPIISILGVLEFIVFICGSVWVFQIFQPKYSPGYGEIYCNKTVYLFAFVYMCSIYVIVLIAALVMFVCCYTYMMACCRACKDDSTIESGS